MKPKRFTSTLTSAMLALAAAPLFVTPVAA